MKPRTGCTIGSTIGAGLLALLFAAAPAYAQRDGGVAAIDVGGWDMPVPRPCTDDSSCSPGEACTTLHVCVYPECRSDSDCAVGAAGERGHRCDPRTFTCGCVADVDCGGSALGFKCGQYNQCGCTNNDECDASSVCANGGSNGFSTCFTPSCRVDADCAGDSGGHRCDPTGFYCVCDTNSDCSAGDLCAFPGGYCETPECRTDADCDGAANGHACHSSEGYCTCRTSLDCPAGSSCYDGDCYPPFDAECIYDGDCTVDAYCEAGACLPFVRPDGGDGGIGPVPPDGGIARDVDNGRRDLEGSRDGGLFHNPDDAGRRPTPSPNSPPDLQPPGAQLADRGCTVTTGQTAAGDDLPTALLVLGALLSLTLLFRDRRAQS